MITWGLVDWCFSESLLYKRFYQWFLFDPFMIIITNVLNNSL